MRVARFWGTALAAALGFALATAYLVPYELLGAEDEAARQRVWLLTLWTGGVMAICFGGAGLITAVSPLGFRDVAEVGSVAAALEARRHARQGHRSFFHNFAGWTVGVGIFLILAYFGAWLLTR